ncbi:hypothetical protein, partial [Phocaeicola coprocola]|uniref:hypothetical protein n=1 Tax=Phocaeicola coprocola TaxID=310298 RepID=UPI00242B6495
TIRFIVTVAIVVYKGLKLVVYRMLTVRNQRKKEPPVCANSADTGGFYTNLQIYLANLLKKQAFFFIALLLYP